MKMFSQRKVSPPDLVLRARWQRRTSRGPVQCAVLCLLAGYFGAAAPSNAAEDEPPSEPRQVPPLAWDSTKKEHTAKEGELTALFTFNVTNTSSAELIISNAIPSCGCTVAKLPSQPWHLAPGSNGQIEVAFDMKGKYGTMQKLVTVVTSSGSELLWIKVNMPPRPAHASIPQTNRANIANSMQRFPERLENMKIAGADRQAIFKNECAKCHVEPTTGKHGKELYAAACGICHDALHRAGMVPDLASITNIPNREYWMNWAAHGKPGTLMPAFAQSEGGPLSKEQIDSLASYLVQNPPQKPVSQKKDTAPHGSLPR